MSKAWKATERRISNALSKWWTGHEGAFKRAPCSGGWPSARMNGDMVANIDDRSIPQEVRDAARLFTDTWSLDVKRRVKGSRGKKKDGVQEKWSIEELLTAPKHPIIQWWLEMNELSATRGPYRFLVANKATYHSYVIFGEREIAYIRGCAQAHVGVQYEPWRWAKFLGPSLTIDGVSPQVPEQLTVLELRAFLKHLDARILGGLGDGEAGAGSARETAP